MSQMPIGVGTDTPIAIRIVVARNKDTGAESLVGWELWVFGTRWLVFADQSDMPGIRVGEQGFVPGLRDELIMGSCYEERSIASRLEARRDTGRPAPPADGGGNHG